MSKPVSASSQSTVERSLLLDAPTLRQRIQDCFATIQDPRSERTQLHQLSDILTIAILSTIAGGQGWEDMEVYGESKQAWLSTFLALPNGIPSADTFRRLFERIDPQQFEQCFEQWVNLLVENLDVNLIAIDGKGVNGSYDRSVGRKALHLVSAWASEYRLVLAQLKVQDRSNEITALPALLELLDLKGAIVTLDAMGTQKQIASQIYTAQADYVLTLKANHPTLFKQVEQWFKDAREQATLPSTMTHTTEAGHHRIDTRQGWAIALDQLPPLHQSEEWLGLQSIVLVERTRQLWNKTTHEIQFYLSSLGADDPRTTDVIRQHWSIENSQHWVLDVTFGEDDCRVRSLHAPHNLALIRRFALNALNRETSSKRSLKQKSKQAAMNDAYMLTVLTAALPEPGQNLKPSGQ
ncbi:MAG TPA: ISAs1 family transposase [Allocoleopsis sp.]